MIRNLFTKVAAGLMVLACTQSYAGDNYWKKFDGKTAPSRQPMGAAAKEYNIFTLDQQSMRSFLFDLSISYDNAKQIFIPTPDRKFRSFHVWKTPMMEPGLADRYPEIQTFTAVADDDPNVTAKLDYTLFGFSAQVIDGDRSYMVDPYNNEADGFYVAFYKNDYTSSVANGICGVNTTLNPTDNGNPTTLEPHGNAAQRLNGSLRHVYRLALSCTGEYAVNAVGPNPSKSQVLSKMVTTINRVNGYYEREVSVSMNLIANNDAVIYTDPTTDPYNCNLNLNCLIGEVQTNITNVIGPQNYDIGHIVCTAGGGLAQLSAVCGGGKASGTSTSGGPDDIHVILHEMGHQYGSNHTFSAGTGGCSGNGNAGTAYEPGAGISTMSYSGLCDPNNVGSATDDYFHVSSLNEINSFLSGAGSGCGVINTGTTPVTIPLIVDSFYIPRNTPFELTAPIATAPQAAASILYSWEQWDLGNFEGTEADNGDASKGPLFRSYYPATSRIRSYPEYTNIISGNYGNGASGKGQRLAKVARTVRFKLTVRSIYQGWGTFQFMDTVVRLKVDAGSADFRVTSQNAPEIWTPASTKKVTWDVGNTDKDSVKCKWVNIYLSLDDGATFPYLLVANAPNTGSYNVTVPDVYSTTGRVKVKGAGNVFYDINKGAITLNGNPNSVPELELNEDIVVFPNPATDRVVIMNKNQYNKDLKAVMYNAVGQRVWSGVLNGKTEVNVGNFARGNYMIQFINVTSGVRTTHKVVLK